MPKQAILFDLDGTLLDSAPDLIACAQRALLKHNLAYDKNINFRQYISSGARAMLAKALEIEVASAELDAPLATMLSLYDDSCSQSSLFTGVTPLLQHIINFGMPWGIVTNKSKRFTHKICAQEPLLQKANLCVCPEDVAKAKPAPDGLELACKQFGIKPENCLYVGDAIKDMQAADTAGCRFVFASYGYANSIPKWAMHNIEKPQDLILYF